ncbi:hypothetical protein ACFV4F_06115 [Kitasatospora sp. NPDC059722]|uniref:hypothetical protein n=1 Tax=Kitasatospora sp. NPDC059722 TaxID=3346925 RepID=UPI003678BA06
MSGNGTGRPKPPGVQLPWIAEEPVPPRPTAAERLRTAVDVVAACLPLNLRRLGDRSRWDPRRVAMAASMATGVVLLIAAPFLKPGATAGDPAAAAAPTGSSPFGTHGRAHPPTSSPTDPAASPDPAPSPSPSATTVESPSATPSATDTHLPSPTAVPARSSAAATPSAAAATPAPAAPTSAAPPAPPASPVPPAPQPAGFRAVAGPGCSGPGARYQEVGAFHQGTDGWVTVNSGGYTGDSCNGQYDAVPMSGDRAKDDNSTYALWTFDVGASAAGCAVSVYVPDSTSVQQVGGAPAYYTVAGASGADLGSFTVDQVSRHGSWVDAGTFRPQGGPLVIRLHNRGQDWTGSGQPTHAHLAGAALRVTCQG